MLIFAAFPALAQVPIAPGNKTATMPAASAGQDMQFSDQPNFSVAGVADWTAVGGHGSDSILRTSESLASATAALVPRDATGGGASISTSADASKADDYRRNGTHFEESGDAVSAVHAFEQAVSLDPSEANYFAWGSELLLHRAIWQAQEVFRKGSAADPQSVRMNTAFGAALFAGARYEEAAQRFCAASDLDPADAEPYLFMGRMQAVAPDALPCIAPHLARFLSQRPGDPEANYLYSISLLKKQESTPGSSTTQQAESLLKQAVALNPQYGDAYLQLGNLANAKHDTQHAIEFYKTAIRVSPSLADAHYRLGVLYDRTGEHDQAKLEFAAHDQLEQQQTARTEQQRREIKQFVFARPDASSPSGAP